MYLHAVQVREEVGSLIYLQAAVILCMRLKIERKTRHEQSSKNPKSTQSFRLHIKWHPKLVFLHPPFPPSSLPTPDLR